MLPIKIIPISSVLCALFISVSGFRLHLDSLKSKAVWTLHNENNSISTGAAVPGGVYSDLQAAGVIGDVLWRDNDVLTRWVAYDTWTYTASFYVNADNLKYDSITLVLEGVDTFAYVELNGSPVGSTQNMFVRYAFDVKQHLQAGHNELKVTFDSAVLVARNLSQRHFTAPACVPDVYHGECHANQVRKMQASFSWDWGPAFPSVGIWKPIFLEFRNSPVIRSLTTHIEKQDSTWHVRITAHFEGHGKSHHLTGFLSAILSVEGHQNVKIGRDLDTRTRNDGTAEVDMNMKISENMVRLWWPNGYGEQPLYDLNVVFADVQTGSTSHKHVKIGFRTIELVEEDASRILGNNTAGEGLTFYFKVNGYPIFMKGSNWIPSHILPEHSYNKMTIDNLLRSAVVTHTNMIRVWGGGLWEDDYFYRRCDELGLLVWQDLLFACSMYPAHHEFLENVKTEVEQNVIRLQHHPSVAIWGGNNENEVALRGNWYDTETQFDRYKREYITLYVDTIKPVVEALDPTRRYLVSSPSNGIKSEQDGYIAENPYDPHYGDTHYYNYVADNWDFSIYPNTRFASEYGFQSLPSKWTLQTASNLTSDYSVDSEFVAHRQHSPNGYSFIEAQIGRHLALDKDDANYFDKFIFYSQIIQAMAMKVETEFYRQSQRDWYTMGALYWQLNDVWQAPSWSGIEFGGRWKMLHYYAKSFFEPVLVSPRKKVTGDVDVYLINDRFVPITEAKIFVDTFKWDSLVPIKSENYTGNVGPLQSEKQVSLELWDEKNKDEIFMRFSVKADGVSYSPYNYVFPVPLKDVKGLTEPKIKITVRKAQKSSVGQNKFVVNINVDRVVAFLWLETCHIDGRYSDNGLILTEADTEVVFHTHDDVTAAELHTCITENIQYYVNK
ncbi:beta-mannosidase [Aricia agestis]|uniref:beta-mannosidase n=1 Tax=Aricia agestis TaxID=91739 RepID=UPI001C2021DB|nr:beta-mannosidase [Aricia agestis]